MDAQKVKARKMKVVVKKSGVRILLDMFYRVVEITVVMVTVVKLCYQLVITLQGSALAGFLINRHLAFVLGNALVIAIVVKCGFFVNQEPDARENTNDFYDEFVRESARAERTLQTDVICREKQTEAENESSEDKREKQSSFEERENKDITVKRHRQTQDSLRQSYERSRSERLDTETSADAFVSDDELRYKIESFIARQRRNQKDEEFCIL